MAGRIGDKKAAADNIAVVVNTKTMDNVDKVLARDVKALDKVVRSKGQFQNYGQENWRTQRGSSQEGRSGQQYGPGESGQYGFGRRGQFGGQSGWGGPSAGSQYGFSQSDFGYGEGQFGQGRQFGYGQRGQFSGRGPKGYRRSDDRIKEDINERLTQDPDIDAWDIEVQVSGGEATLTGTVDDREAKRRAEDVAEQVSGVKDVQNQIKVKKGDEDQNSEFKKGTTSSSELSSKEKSGQSGMKANIK